MRKVQSASSRSTRPKAGVNGALRIGISGWTYRPWRGVFYPAGHPQKRGLEYASRALRTIEINGTFYSLQRPSSFLKWYSETPADFIFSVKDSRFITHMKKLRDSAVPLAIFFASGLLCLGKKLGPILWQFPPNFGWNEERFREFFALLPRTKEAAQLAKLHNEKLKGRAWTKTDACRPLRYAVEIRHQPFSCQSSLPFCVNIELPSSSPTRRVNGLTRKSSRLTSSIGDCMAMSSSTAV